MSEQFLSKERRLQLAKVLDARFNIPIIKGHRELNVFIKIVDSVDRLMRKYIHDEVLETMTDPDLEIEDMVKSALKDNLVPILSQLVLPLIPGAVKLAVFNFLIDFLVDAMADATTIDEKAEEFLEALA
ncbi:MAG: hypothetical protein HRU31_01265 [Rhodobacteraceae bacterium]|nr:hypothetical protein [Paracoccaceae bacterium]